MAEQPGFPQFYNKALTECLDRSGRPDPAFFKKLAGFGGANSKYYLKLAGKDWLGSVEGARDIEPSAFSHPKVKSHFVRYFGPTALNFHYMEVHARASKALSAADIDAAEKHVDSVITKATNEIDQYTAASEELLRQSGATKSVRYGASPLLIPCEIVSPYCNSYVSLILKADNLYGLLEYQRLRRLVTNQACDLEFARIDRLLKSVSRSAFNLARGLRARTQGQPEKDKPETPEKPAAAGSEKAATTAANEPVLVEEKVARAASA